MNFLVGCALLAVTLGTAGCCCFTTAYDLETYQTWRELEYGLNVNPQSSKRANENLTIEEQTGVRIRLPLAFDPSRMGPPLMAGSVENGQPVPATRLHPPGGELPGHYLTHEMYIVAGPNNKLPIYCYVGALPKKADRAEIREQINEKLKVVYPDLEPKWEKGKKLAEGTDNEVAVDYLTLTTSQEFNPQGKSPTSLRGRLDIYIVPKEHATVVVGWRAPADIGEEVSLFKAAENAVVNITSEKPAEPIKEEPPTPEGGTTEPPAAGEYVQFPSVPVEIKPPAGFVRSAQIEGFQKEGAAATITIEQFPNPYESMVAAYSNDYFKNNNLSVGTRETKAAADGSPGTLWFINRPAGGPYWMYVFGDEDKTNILTGSLGENFDEATRTAVREAILTARPKP